MSTMAWRIRLCIAVAALAIAFTAGAGCGPGVQRTRQRQAGLRDPDGSWRADVAPEFRGHDDCHQGSRRAGRPSVSERRAGNRLPRSSHRWWGDVGATDGALDAAGPAEHERLQPDDPLQRLRLPDHSRRHQAGHRRAPAVRRDERRAGRGSSAGPGRSDPDLDRVLGLRVRGPGRPAERDRDPREPDGLHGGRREHARHRLLGRRLRLLRAAAEPRRVRRDRDDRSPVLGPAPQGRDDGHLLRRDQPAVHGADQPAEPGSDLAALGARRHPDDPLSGRHPEHGLRLELGHGASPRRPAGRTQHRAALGLPEDPGRRPAVQGQPGAARRGGEPLGEGPGQQPLRAERWPTPWRRSRSSTRSTRRSTWPASGPTSRRAVTVRLSPSTSPAPSASGSRSRTAPTSTRSIRRPSTAGTTS